MKNCLVKSVLASVFSAWAGLASAVPLDALFAGGSIAVGDVVFDNWTLDNSLEGSSTTHTQIDMSAIDVMGVVFGPTDFGLVFDAGDELFLPVTGQSDFLGLFFNYAVTVVGGGNDISSIFIDADYDLFAGTAEPASDQSVYAEKEVFTPAGASLGFLVEWNQNPALPNTLAVSGTSFLIKDFMEVEVSEGGARLNSWEQRFSTAIPVPTVFTLFGAGLLCLAWVRKRINSH